MNVHKHAGGKHKTVNDVIGRTPADHHDYTCVKVNKSLKVSCYDKAGLIQVVKKNPCGVTPQ